MTRRESAAIRRDLDLIGKSETVAGLGDADLLGRFASRRGAAADAAFEAIVLRHGPMVRGVCRSILRDPGDADDAFQATFLVLIRRAGSVRVGDSLAPWLYGVAWKVAVKSRAIARKRRSREASSARAEVVVRDDPDADDIRPILLEEVARLPERYRVPVVLCHLEGRTHEDAARLLRCPAGTISSRLSRARDLLRSRLGRRGLGVPAAMLASALAPREALALPTTLLQSVVRFAQGGKVSTTVTHLVEGVLSSMIMAKLKLAGLAFLAAVGLGVGARSVAGGLWDVEMPDAVEARADPAGAPVSQVDSPGAEQVQEPEPAKVEFPPTRVLPRGEPMTDPGKPSRTESVVAPVLSGITIDGELGDWPAAMPRYSVDKLLNDDPAFGRLGPGGLEGADLSTSPDLSAAFSVGYDPRKQVLYLAVIVRDDDLVIGHTSHLDTDALEVYVDGLLGNRRIPLRGDAEFGRIKLPEFPVQQYIAIPGAGRVYGTPQETNPILMGGDLERTRTRMAFSRKGDVTTYEWAIQVFDEYPDRPTRLEPGKRIGFDLSIADKDVPAVSPRGLNEPREDRTAWIYWGPQWNGMKLMDAGSLGELILGR